jgi:imidazolonepropionase-like amidohydrolase
MKHITTALLVLLSIAHTTAQSTYLHCGQLLTMQNGKASIQSEMTVIVEGKKIMQVERGYLSAPKNATAIDLKNQTVLPGIIDCHVHIEWEITRRSYTEKYLLNPADIAFRSAVFAERTLLTGITTVRDLGGTGVNIALRDAIAQGLTPGPRILTAGRMLSVTGGHGDAGTGSKWDLFDAPVPEEGIADGPDECRAAVRTQIKRGADWIKVAATGGVPVTAHAHGDEGIRRAVRAGVVSIEHGSFAADSTLDLMKQYGTWLVPTLTAGWACTDSALANTGFFPPLIAAKALVTGPTLQKTLGRAYQRGVKIAFGTDAGVCPHGTNLLEFGYMADAGMTAPDILRAATYDAASMLRILDKTGSIEVGKFADIIAIDGEPLKNIRSMQYVKWVMKEGKVYK